METRYISFLALNQIGVTIAHKLCHVWWNRLTLRNLFVILVQIIARFGITTTDRASGKVMPVLSFSGLIYDFTLSCFLKDLATSESFHFEIWFSQTGLHQIEIFKLSSKVRLVLILFYCNNFFAVLPRNVHLASIAISGLYNSCEFSFLKFCRLFVKLIIFLHRIAIFGVHLKLWHKINWA